MKITKKEMIESEKEIGYICDICHKEVIYEYDFLPQKNILKWNSQDGWGRDALEETYVCSMECLIKALKNAYFGAEIKLSYDFLESLRKIK